MRVIKFRAWIAEDERMLHSDHDVDEDYMEVWGFDGIGPTVQVQELRFREGGGEIYEEVRYVDAKCEIMQFTGLKDVNGIEIYEGDILEWTSWKPEHYPYKNIVYYFAGGTQCGFRLKSKSFNKPLTGNGVYNAKAKVIGNIHQNPDLLTV